MINFGHYAKTAFAISVSLQPLQHSIYTHGSSIYELRHKEPSDCIVVMLMPLQKFYHPAMKVKVVLCVYVCLRNHACWMLNFWHNRKRYKLIRGERSQETQGSEWMSLFLSACSTTHSLLCLSSGKTSYYTDTAKQPENICAPNHEILTNLKS